MYGSDIDGRQMRGKGKVSMLRRQERLTGSYVDKTPGIMRAAKQYGVSESILDLCTFDVTKNPWRCGELFDAIITDPPCEFRVPCSWKLTLNTAQMGFVRVLSAWAGKLL